MDLFTFLRWTAEALVMVFYVAKWLFLPWAVITSTLTVMWLSDNPSLSVESFKEEMFDVYDKERCGIMKWDYESGELSVQCDSHESERTPRNKDVEFIENNICIGNKSCYTNTSESNAVMIDFSKGDKVE